jgi:hypothetical protein
MKQALSRIQSRSGSPYCGALFFSIDGMGADQVDVMQ